MIFGERSFEPDSADWVMLGSCSATDLVIDQSTAVENTVLMM